jgi:glycerophosphoryl diester phosphodiesterase
VTLSITVGGKTAALTCHMAALSGRFRPNSRAAIRECLDAGVPAIEIDVHSLDGPDYIVTHDRRLERSTTGAGSIGQATPDDLRAVHFLDDATDRPALLSEVAEMARGCATRLQLDLKDWRPLREARLRALLDVITPIRAQVLVSAGEDWNLQRLHDADPELAIGFDPGRYIGFAGAGEPEFLPRTRGAYGYLDDHPMAIARTDAPADYLCERFLALARQCPSSREMFLDHRLILQMLDDGFETAAWLHEHGSALTAWTVDYRGVESIPIVERLVAAGVDQITTNTALAWVEAFAGAAPERAGGQV